jgi:chemotaxis signal transduction protein
VSGWLVVRSAERTLALPVGMVEELVAVPPPLSVPGVVAAVRGVAPFQGRLVPLVHLGAAISGAPPPPALGTTGVAVRLDGRRVLLEVDDATELTAADAEPLPHGWRGRWASSAVRQGGTLVPILDPAWLAERLTGGSAGSATA